MLLLLLLLFLNKPQNSYFWHLSCPNFKHWSALTLHHRHHNEHNDRDPLMIGTSWAIAMLVVVVVVCWFNFKQFDSFHCRTQEHKSQKEKRWKLVSDLSIDIRLVRFESQTDRSTDSNHELVRGWRMLFFLSSRVSMGHGKPRKVKVKMNGKQSQLLANSKEIEKEPKEKGVWRAQHKCLLVIWAQTERITKKAIESAGRAQMQRSRSVETRSQITVRVLILACECMSAWVDLSTSIRHFMGWRISMSTDLPDRPTDQPTGNQLV